MNTDNSFNNEVRYELDNGTRTKMSLKKQGAMNPNYNKVRSPETARKISDSLKKYHQQKTAFEEAERLAVTKRIWDKFKFASSQCFKLVRCNDEFALYQLFSLDNQSNFTERYRLYSYDNGVFTFIELDNLDGIQSYFDSSKPIIVSENRNKVVVLGFKS
jgi:hypothetical protein